MDVLSFLKLTEASIFVSMVDLSDPRNISAAYKATCTLSSLMTVHVVALVMLT